ncbi:hypothetical protein, conserved [Babesia bigemina]|uniref:Uncharacterized protein n=1 Tax=Babesia bigemina TaxID=5866 RepID=A0A061D198_BABBI|nr:hypothetical protein, conserved [Babesia bigemina]CDR94408.1 hypothetical protein, conserved [Babesia bigemina]|eukprot:XP_012766594.1 hypothetical protein, conserved [Babesia bigemina]
MSYLRKDRVYVVSNFFAMAMAGFAAFMSGDFIRLLCFDTLGDESYWIFAYQMTMWVSTLAASLVKTPAAPSLMYCLRINIFFLVSAAVGFFMQWFESISFHFVIVIWAYITGLALVNAVVFASYHHSGSRGLMLGSMLSFATTYGVLELVKYWTWKHGELGKYRNIVLAYLILRLVMNCAAMSFLSSGAQETHFEQFDKAFELIKSGVMMEWLSGTLHERDVQLALKEVTPHYVSPVAGVRYIFEKSDLTVVWLIFLAMCLSCSIFTPYIAAANWDLSVFKMGHIDRAEHVGNLMGVIVAVTCKRSWFKAVGLGLVYVVHAALGSFLTYYVHSYRMSLRMPLEAMCVLTCVNASFGSFLTVSTFIHFFELAVNLRCTNQEEKTKLPQLCCRDDESSECLCSEQFCDENCGTKTCDVEGSKKVKIYIPPNTEEMYRLWLPGQCLLCWLYRHNPDEVCKIPCYMRTNQEQTKLDECEIYLLRNCKVSLCGYCDMNLLMECVKVECICKEECNIPLPNANMYKEDEECQKALKEKEKKHEEKEAAGSEATQPMQQGEPQQPATASCAAGQDGKVTETSEQPEETVSQITSEGSDEGNKDEESDEETDEKPIKKPLHEICLCEGKNVSIVTTSSSEFVVRESSCCDSKNTEPTPRQEDVECESDGREFKLSSMCCYSCCHYGLKVMMRLKAPNNNFHLMQQPYPGKFDPIGCLVFNGRCNNDDEHKKLGEEKKKKSDQKKREKEEKKRKEKEKQKQEKESQKKEKEEKEKTEDSEAKTEAGAKKTEDEDDILEVEEDADSLKYACPKSTLKSITRVACGENTKDDNGLCACCKTAQKASEEKKREKEKTPKKPEVPSPKPVTPAPQNTYPDHPECCHMKVQPTALPFHFKEIDLKRNSYVGALFFIILIFGTAKLIVAIAFAALDVKYGLDLSSNFNLIKPFYEKSVDPITYGINTALSNEDLLKQFTQEMEYSSPPKLAAMVPLQRWMESPSFDSIYEDNVRVFSTKPEESSTEVVDEVENADGDANDESRAISDNGGMVSSSIGLPSLDQLGEDDDVSSVIEEKQSDDVGSDKKTGDAITKAVKRSKKGTQKNALEPQTEEEDSVVNAEDEANNDSDVDKKAKGSPAVEKVVRSAIDGGESESGNKSDDEEEEEDLTLVGYEKKAMEAVLEQYKWLCNDLEYAFVENWVQETTDLKNKDDEDVEKIKRIRRVKWCLDCGLKVYAYQSADAIMVYLESMCEKWDAEMTHYGSAVTKKLKVVGDNVSMLSPMKMAKIGDHDWQAALTDAQITLWREASADAEKLAKFTKQDKQLREEATAARGVDMIVTMIALWEYRVEVINELTNDGEVFLSWRQFMHNWELILSWKENFLALYLEEYKGVKSLETDGAEAQE